MSDEYCVPHSVLCAPAAKGISRQAYLHDQVEPAFHRDGFSLAPSVVQDLGCMYLEGEAIRFSSPWNQPGARDAAERYCAALNDAVNGPLGELLFRCRVAREHGMKLFQGGAHRPRPGELPETAGILFFIETIAAQFDRGFAFAGSFWQTYFGSSSRPGFNPFVDAFAAESVRLTAQAAAARPNGAAMLDLDLLQACLEYVRTETDIRRFARLRVLLRSPSAERLAATSELEFGNNGITRKGKISALLRSEFARAELVERLALHQSLFYERESVLIPKRRVVVVLAIDRGTEMLVREKENRCRLDTIARQTAAAILEDIARNFGSEYALELRMAMAFHNGSTRDFKRRLMPPVSRDELRRATALDNSKSGSATGWLPGVLSMLRTFLVREPEWDAPTGFSINSSAPIAALQCVCEMVKNDDALAEFTLGPRYDLCLAFVLGPLGAFKNAPAVFECPEFVRRTETVTLGCGPAGVEWQWPKSRRGEPGPVLVGAVPGLLPPNGHVRKRALDHLCTLLESL